MTGHSKESTQLDENGKKSWHNNTWDHKASLYKHPSLPLASKFSKGYFEKFLSLWAFIKTIGTVSGIRNRGSWWGKMDRPPNETIKVNIVKA